MLVRNGVIFRCFVARGLATVESMEQIEAREVSCRVPGGEPVEKRPRGSSCVAFIQVELNHKGRTGMGKKRIPKPTQWLQP